jgi:translocation and assembly module TamB
VAKELEIEWLSHPRYAGTVTGRFFVQGTGGDAATMAVRGGGRLDRADLFGGTLSAADVTIAVDRGTLEASYDGAFENLDPVAAGADPRFEGRLNGTVNARVSVRDLLIRSPVADGYSGDVALRLDRSSLRGVHLDSARLTTSLDEGILRVSQAIVAGPKIDAQGTGTIALDTLGNSQFKYTVNHVDLSLTEPWTPSPVSGIATIEGQLSGPRTALHLTGHAAINELDATGFRALTTTATYNVVTSLDEPAETKADIELRSGFVTGFGQALDEIVGTTTFDRGLLNVDLVLMRSDFVGSLAGSARFPSSNSVEISSLTLGVDETRWLLMPARTPWTVAWHDVGVTVGPAEFSNAASPAQRVGISGSWMRDGSGALRITAADVAIETLPGIAGDPAPYAGVLTLDATLSGTREQPIVTGTLAIENGRVRRLSYGLLIARVDYIGGMFEIGVRLDQSPGVWLTAAGAVPLGLFDRRQPERPMHVSIASTPVSLGLIEGLTDVVHDVTGQVQLNISAVGTSHDPRFSGTVILTDTGFVVTASGARYRDGRGTIELARDRLTVRDLSLRDTGGHALTVTGSVGTSELRLEELELEVIARDFEVVRNQFGTTNIDATLGLRGRVESPQVSGAVTITEGQLRADRILDRVLFQPYALAARLPAAPIDAIAALNPWDRLSLDIELHVPGTLRMTGDNVQVASGTPLGFGNIDLRLAGDLRLRKGPAETLSVTGALDQITGRYAFQGRRFDLDPASTITFRGDLNPDLFITVNRIISGVEVRVTISGPLRDPELRLASAPPLDSSEILSLIVFNTSTNQLSAAQQEELAVRAGTLAAGFLAAPLVTALERTIGIDLLEIEAAETGGARVTIGDEIAPGLVARFSRQFGADEYDEAAIEYYLSRIFRIRATFSDAGSTVRSPFRRVERAGIDLLLFFSF